MRRKLIDLSPYWEYILTVAATRLENNKTDRHEYRFGTIIEDEGAAGEMAGRKEFGLPLELHTGFDNGIDFVFRGRKINVKATPLFDDMSRRHLQWREGNPFLCDVVILVGVDMKRKMAEILGYATIDEVRNAPINRNRPVACHEIPIPNLHPVSELYADNLPNRSSQVKPSYHQVICEAVDARHAQLGAGHDGRRLRAVQGVR